MTGTSASHAKPGRPGTAPDGATENKMNTRIITAVTAGTLAPRRTAGWRTRSGSRRSIRRQQHDHASWPMSQMMSGPQPRDQMKTIMSDMTSDSELREQLQSVMTDAMKGMDGPELATHKGPSESRCSRLPRLLRAPGGCGEALTGPFGPRIRCAFGSADAGPHRGPGGQDRGLGRRSRSSSPYPDRGAVEITGRSTERAVRQAEAEAAAARVHHRS